MGHPAPGKGQHTVGPQFPGALSVTLVAEGRLQWEGWRVPGEERGWGSSGVRGGQWG